MAFSGILFPRPEAPVRREAAECLHDLNLDQIVQVIASSWEEYDLTPFFLTRPTDLDTLAYRQEIMRDLEAPALMQVNVLAQSAEDVLGFFVMLWTELAFYIGCLNLHERLAALAAPVCFPQPFPVGSRRQRCRTLYDVCLVLQMGQAVIGNELDAEGVGMVIITGANQGGKSSFLRGIGLAQLMMQCGMFVAANSFEAELCTALFTHYKREEEASMLSGKFDEELARMSDIADRIAPNALLLFNESFAATNEREGAEIAGQVVRALLEKHIKIFFVTHSYEFSHGLFDRQTGNTLFLRAERLADGTRTFHLAEGEPLETSHGEDLYRRIFNDDKDGGKT